MRRYKKRESSCTRSLVLAATTWRSDVSRRWCYSLVCVCVRALQYCVCVCCSTVCYCAARRRRWLRRRWTSGDGDPDCRVTLFLKSFRQNDAGKSVQGYQQTVQLDRKKGEDAQRKCSNLYFVNELYFAMFGNCQSYLSHIFTAPLLQILLDSLYFTDGF